jgi:hypothetical protein
VLPVRAIATLRGISADAAEAELREAGVVPADHPVAWSDAAQLPDPQVDLTALDADLDTPAEPEVR